MNRFFSKRLFAALGVLPIASAIAVLTVPSQSHAGPEPNLLDDNRGNTALQATLSTAFTAAGTLASLPADPFVLAPIPYIVPKRALGHPSIHNLYVSDDWNGENPNMPTTTQIDAFTRSLTQSTYFSTAGQYGVGNASFTGSHGTSLACALTDSSPFLEFVQLPHWVACMTSFDPFGLLPGLLPPLSGVPSPGDDSLYVLYVPPGSQVIDAQAPAYHFYTAVPDPHFDCIVFPLCVPVFDSRIVPFAVVTTNDPRSQPFDAVMTAASHEIIESSTDPYVGTGWINNSVVTSGSFLSDLVNVFSNISLDLQVGEAADICEQDDNPHLDPPASQHPTPPFAIPVSNADLGTDHIEVAPYWSNKDDACGPFFPPKAKCQDLMLNADGECLGGPIDPKLIDAGSTGTGALTFSLDNAGPYHLGATNVTLTVTDPRGLTGTCMATVTVNDVTPPVVTPPAAVMTSFCATSQLVNVGQATATDNCATNLVPAGQVIAKNGIALATPIPVVNGQVTLDIGTYTIQWSVSDGHNTGSALQTVVIGSTIQAGTSFMLADRGKVLNATGGSGAILNSGSGLTQIGNDASSGGILSVGTVNVLDRAVVGGGITSAGAINASSTATTGARAPFATVALPPLPSLPAFPAPGGNVTVNSGSSSPAPGSYGSITVNGGTLNLAAGDYFIQSLTINAGVTVRATPTTRLFVKSSLGFQSSILATSGTAVQPVFLGFAGSGFVSMLARFDGTLLAPNATVSFGTGSGLTFTGAFYVGTFQVQPASTLVCQSSLALPPGEPPSPTCNDGIKNGNETGVDCGGSCRACPTNGTNLSTALSITTDWGTGYCAVLIVNNNGAAAVSSWSVNLDLGTATNYTTWNGSFTAATGHSTVTPSFSWNQPIAAGTSNDSVGFCANRAAGSTGTASVLTTTGS